MNKKIIDALPNILKRLSNTEGIHLPTLAKELDVPKNTLRDHFDRYLKTIPLSNIQYNQSTKNWTAKQNFLSETLLSADEMIVMKILEESSLKFGENFSKNTKKLFTRFKKRSSLRIYKKVKMEKLNKTDEKHLAIIQNAIENKQVLTLIYNNKEREINPLKIVQLEGYWYLFLWDRKDDIMKSFYFKGIKNIKLQNDFYNDDKEHIIEKLKYAINAYFKDKESYEVELQVHKKVSIYLKRLPISQSQQFFPCKDDDYERLTLQITDDMEIIPTIQRYLPYIKVISPDRLHKQILENINNYKEINLS